MDRDVLTDGMELTDNLINATLVLLGAQFPKLDGFQNTILGHHLDFKRVSDSRPSVQILHTGIVSRFTLKVQTALLYLQSDCLYITDRTYIVSAPYCIAGNRHWVCTSRTSSGTVQIMDSLGLFMKMNVATLLQISKIYPPSNSVLQLHKLSVQQQDGTLDCGLFAIAFAVVCLGGSTENVSFDQKMRRHLYDCLNGRSISAFPKKSPPKSAFLVPLV